jgi:hypothetical protein
MLYVMLGDSWQLFAFKLIPYFCANRSGFYS